MTTVDIIIAIVALGSAFMGWRKGLMVQLGGLAAIVAGVVACRLWGDAAQAWLMPYCTVEGAALTEAQEYFYTVLARLLLFVGVWLVIKLAARFLRGVTRALRVGFFDRMGGMVLAMFEWLMALSLALNLWLVVKPGTDVKEMGRMFNGHAAEAVTELAPAVLGWAMEMYPAAEGDGEGEESAGEPQTAPER